MVLGVVLGVNGFGSTEIRFTGHTRPTVLRRLATLTAVQHLLPLRLADDAIIAIAHLEQN